MSIHIIPAVFTSLRSVTTERREQWSYGQVLQISGDIELPETFEAHFCCDGDCETKKRLGQNNLVKVPKMYMETGRTVLCYIFLHDAETDGRTMYTIRIPILRRPKPTDIEPSPEESDFISDAIAAMQAARADIEELAEDAHRAIDDAIEEAIEEAKESGEFKGDKGDKGDAGQDGQDGHSPVVTASKSGTVTTISVDGTAIATVNDGDDYILTAQDKQDIANLVDISSKADAVIIHVGDAVGGNMYEIDRTYSEINTALNSGANVVLTDDSVGMCPYVGVLSENSMRVIAFGVSATYNGTATLYGYLILPNNYALKVEQYTAIPVNLSDLTDDVGYVKNITANKSGTVTTIYSDGTAIATINDGNDYTLTAQDKTDIANLVIQILPTAQGVSF